MADGVKVGELYGVLRLDKGPFDGAMRSAGAAFTSLSKVAVVGAAAIVTALVGIASASAKMAVDFEKDMANIETLLGTGSGVDKRVDELAQSVKDMSIETGKSLEDLSGGLYDVIGTFGDTAESADWLRVAAVAGSAGMSTTKEAIGLLSAVTKAYGDTSLEAAQKASDLAFQTANLGVTTFPEMAAAMGKVLPLAATMKVSQEELFGAMATLTGVTGGTSEVVTQLAASMNAVLKPNLAMKQALKELGFVGATAGQDLVAKHGLVGAMELLKDTSIATEKQGLAKMLGSSEALIATLSLTGAQAEDFKNKTAAMGEAAGATAAAFEIQQATVGASQERIAAAFNVMFVTLGEKLLPVLATVLEWVTAHLPEISATFEQVFATVGAAISWVAENVIPPLQALFTSVSTEAVPALATAFAWVSETALPAFGNVIAWITENIIPPLERIFTTLTETILPLLQKAFQFVADWIADNWPTISKVVGQVASAVSGAFNIIADVIEVVYPIVAKVAEVLFPLLGAAATILLNVLSTVFDAISVVWETAVDVAEMMVEAIGSAWESLTGVFKTVWDTISGTVKAGANFLIGIINGIIDAVNGIQVHIPRIGIDMPDGSFIGVGPLDWNGLGLGKLDYLASGTPNFRGGLAMLGEQGPELADLPGGTRVNSAGDTTQMLDEMGGSTVNIGNVNLNVSGVQDPEEMAKQGLQALKREIARQGMSLA